MTSIPADQLICPITQEEMKDPVTGSDGITYERSAIEAWFAAGHQTSPLTRQPMSRALYPNVVLRSLIQSRSASVPLPLPLPASGGGSGGSGPPPISLKLRRVESSLHIALSVPEASDAALNTLFIDVLDVSGSMGNPCIEKPSAEGAGFSRADLVRHSVATQIELLRPDDSLALILFDHDVNVALPPTKMAGTGRMVAKACLPQIEPRGGTNIWTGLQRALTLAADVDAAKTNVVIVLQTDGESDPSYSPTRGIAGAFRAWMDAHPAVRLTVHTVGYGFGRALDMPLLRSLAAVGNGTVNYIPDGSMVGTVFIHLLANLMSCIYRDLTLLVSELGFSTHVGFLQSGQTRDIVIPLPSSPVEITLRDKVGIILTQNVDPSTAPVASAGFETARERFIAELQRSLEAMERGELHTLDSLSAVLVSTDPRITALRNDLFNADPNKGQISKAVADAAAFTRWGRHYIPGVLSGHQNQWAINFKDECSTIYGGSMVRRLIDRGDELFTSLPPPKASRAPAAIASAASAASFASLHNHSGGCFTGDSLILMHDGSQRRADNIRPGDRVFSSSGSGPAVRTVVKQIIPDGLTYVVPLGENGCCRITPWHPVRNGTSWYFPANVREVEPVAVSAVYNFVLMDEHTINVDGVIACTLAHNFTGPVVRHPYFGAREEGKRNIMDDLSTTLGFTFGYVTWNPVVQRDPVSGRICGMRDVGFN
jgi:Mg-chelatase subunit ChlD